MVKRTASVPDELWPRYKFFSDSATQPRLDGKVSELAKIKADPSAIKWERPSKLVDDSSWDKYYFFSDPFTKNIVHCTSAKGRKRVAAIGPNTFGPKFVKEHTPPLDESMRLESTTYAESYQDMMPRVRSEPKIEKSIVPHIFPGGHITIDRLFTTQRPAAKAASYMY